MILDFTSAHPKLHTEKDVQKEESTLKIIDDENGTQNDEIYQKTDGWFERELKWRNIISISLFHLYFVYACLTFKYFENLKTLIWREYSVENS